MHLVLKMWLIYTENKFNTYHGVNFLSEIHQKELQELDKVSQKCCQWLILTNYLGMMDKTLIMEAKKDYRGHMIKTCNCRMEYRMVRISWRVMEDFLLRENQALLLNNNIMVSWWMIQIVQVVHKSNKLDHL